jgi:predicted dehydrogenase
VEAVVADLVTFIATRRRPSETASAFAELHTDGAGDEVGIESEDAATILLRFEGGARGACVVSQVSPGRKNALTMEIAGSERSLHWNQEDPEHLWLRDRNQASLLTRDLSDGVEVGGVGVPVLPAGHPEGWADAFCDLFRPFYAAILRGDAPDPDTTAYPTVHDGLRGLEFVEAALDSSRTGRWTSLKPRQ